MDNIRPDYKILANNQDITATIRAHFVDMRFTDEAGMNSDVLEIRLSDEDPLNPVRKPPKGAELELFLGYDGAAQRMGMFIADEFEMGGWPSEMVIRARAAVYDKTPKGKANLQSQKTRSWPKGTKLGAMVAKIAKEHGMESSVAATLKNISLPHVDQSDESDLNLLVRMAKKYDAVVKPADGKLLLAKRGASKTVGGGEMPTITLTPEDLTTWRQTETARDSAGTVVAYYHATKQAKRHEVKVGTGEPVRRLRNYFPDQDMALAAAKAELSKRQRGAVTFSFTMPGRTDLAAEARLVLVGFHPDVLPAWVIKRVEHALDIGGYKCSGEAEQPDATETPHSEDVPET